MSPYIYFPPSTAKPIRTLFLDTNITVQLDLIARKGAKHKEPVVRERIADLLTRLDPDVIVSPGLGAGESVLRPDTPLREPANYARRAANSIRLLGSNIEELRAWLDGGETSIPLQALDEDTGLIPPENFVTVHANMLMPSYAMVLKAFHLHQSQQQPLDALESLAAFCAGLYGRGSRELFLGTLLLAGSNAGIALATTVMKESRITDASSARANLWNTSFDLMHSRLPTLAAVPGFAEHLPEPRVFVTGDKALGELLSLLERQGAVSHPRGGSLGADSSTVLDYVRPELRTGVRQILEASSRSAHFDMTDVDHMTKIRRETAATSVATLEHWLFNEFRVRDDTNG